jgi:hypothetical protein
MMKKIATGGVFLMALASFTGCAEYEKHQQYLLGKEVNGEAPTFNANVHIIDPNPAWAENTDIEVSGERAVGAMERYSTGTDFTPEEVDIEAGN